MKDYCGNTGGSKKTADPRNSSFKQGSFNPGETAKKGSGGDMSAKGQLKNANKFVNAEKFPIGSKGTGDGLSKLANDKTLIKNFPKSK